MIQVQFTDEGKLHTVTFSGEDREHWAGKFCLSVLYVNGIKYECRDISVISEVEAGN